ncbi:synaptojanin-1-like isoform X1 [Mytilus trossulus]|uniref:synaptojanin-1-like isoform X1 n=1 Tax=Mytilus trossulus TaxID=6551 RepID=UPI0030069D95
MAMIKNFRVFHKLEPPPYSIILENRNNEDTLMFESNALAVLSAAETEAIKKQYVKILDAYGCLGVLNFNLGQECVSYLVLVTGCLSVGKIGESDIFKITTTQFVSLRNNPGDEERIQEIKKLMNSGTFYFSWSNSGIPWDLTLCAQRKLQEHETDNRFFWNRMLHVHFQRFNVDCDQWLFKVICGGVEIRTIYASHRQAKACLISRLSCERAGTRFNVRGANDDGNVANFVETEQVIFLDGQISSFIQTRGSVPLFWEQPGIQVGSHKVRMSRGHEASAPAFERHLVTIKQLYGEQVIINLLGRKEGEHMLSQAFQSHHKASQYGKDKPLINFDYHSECRGGNLKNLSKLRDRIKKQLDSFEFFYVENDESKKFQTGTMRTNCLDCLDRTNATQSMIGAEILPKQLECLGLYNKPQMISRFEEIYKQIWTLNGDHCSRIYAGTGALGGGRSKYSDATRSASRTIQNNFLDSSKQEAIDMLLLGSTLRGDLADKVRALLSTRVLHAQAPILHTMIQRHPEYTQKNPLRICVGTWNVNGGKHFRSIAFKHQSMTDWLLDAPKISKENDTGVVSPDADLDKPIDVFAIGFEEIVDLNASNIVSVSTTNAREWQKYILKVISRDHKYVVLTSVQLVGVILYVFVRPQLAPFIRDVATDSAKTGLGGATGNKGGVAIRFLVQSTSVCFVCAHLAAGQSQINDRNSDYAEITRKISFPMIYGILDKGRSIMSHDYVFWCGDFNYRIDLPNEDVKKLVQDENWSALRECDQLFVQKDEGKVFEGFNEGQLNFAPTYKYDLFCDDYDTSDKCRTPAWTDRVLWRRNIWWKNGPNLLEKEDPHENGHLVLYNRSELKTSDHRPVVAVIDIAIQEVIDNKKQDVLDEVIGQQGPSDCTAVVSLTEGEFDDDTVDSIVGTLTDVGEISLVRFVDEDMWLIFTNGKHAIEALQYNNMEMNGRKVQVKLKTVDWKQQIDKEMKLCTMNTGALFNNISNSLLGEDFTGLYDFDSDEDEDDQTDRLTVSENNTPIHSGRNSPALSDDGILDGAPPPPNRPAPPARPNVNPVASEDTGSKEVPAKQPPQRPAPPVKPPPPQRPTGGPMKPVQQSTVAPLKKMPPVRKPLGSQSIKNIKSKKQAKISSIGLPTNVLHHGHAASMQEAQNVIEKLIRGESVDASLPQPLMPNNDELLTPSQIPQSRTAETLSSVAESANEGANVPKPIPRARSTGNITGTINPVPVPRSRDSPTEERKPIPRLRDSPTDDSSIPASRPRPAPRREVQSAFVPSTNSNDIYSGQVMSGLNQNEQNISSQPNSILDAPISPFTKPKADPFDTSNVQAKFINPLYNIPASNFVDNSSQQNGNVEMRDPSFPEPMFSPPSMPPPAPESPPPSPPVTHNSSGDLNESPRLNDQNPPSHPPPNLPPPPPPRPVDGAPTNLPPVPSRPAVPSRPPSSIPNNLPPVPSRSLPPVPPRN